jgi:hypothetical protein
LSALVLDAGAFIAVDRGDRELIAQLRVAQTHGLTLRTTGIVLAQVWRDPAGRQADLARLLHAVEIRAVDADMGRRAGVLLAKAETGDPIDATVVLVAQDGDRVLTSDPRDLKLLATRARKRIAIVAC